MTVTVAVTLALSASDTERAFEPLNASVVSSATVCPAGTVFTGASPTPVRLITQSAVVVARPSLTVTTKVSVVAVLNASIANALGVKVYSPVEVVTARLP